MKLLLDNIFSLSLTVFILLGTILVGTQIISLFTLNGELAITAKAMFAKPAFILASVTGVTAFIMSYVYGWKSGD